MVSIAHVVPHTPLKKNNKGSKTNALKNFCISKSLESKTQNTLPYKDDTREYTTIVNLVISVRVSNYKVRACLRSDVSLG